MPHSENDLPSLFRSLRPDNANLQALAATAESEAGTRWPLLKDLSLKEPELPPALSTEERMRWKHAPDALIDSTRKPALSLPGLSDEMAKSLEKMSRRVAPTVAQQTEPQRAAETPAPTLREVSPENNDHDAHLPPPSTKRNMGLDDTAPTSEVPVTPAELTQSPVEKKRPDVPLMQIFSRLEGIEKPVNRPSLFLIRLGKR